ncbi:hypothetical protein L249_5250 [Ophiocordyceps polyrhachis-furcata BCC 54312]|uniref:Gelsolin-like domain-containing protein n=1 Tax=Ophiocordyceps polyrhachis-furcata BCC 54312 TaxID=1330021 RepID=A0A367L9A5_9HYPO|nr:hypothetical protein L249_5250 [Ophiocordyceps polyrhachis-furcata BCC 54312]
MAPHDGLVHPKEYDILDSNVEFVGSEMDHRVKYNSAATEPAWNDGAVGSEPGLRVWRMEQFQVVPWPKQRYGDFYDGDSYLVLHSQRLADTQKLRHDIFFWLGSHTTQDEAGTAAYKTVELDEFLHGAATQHREVQCAPSDDFLTLFPRISILSGGVRSGFRHVEDKDKQPTRTLLRVFQAGTGGANVVVYEVQPTWRRLDDGDVFVLDEGYKIWVWQGRRCSPMEKAKAAQVVHDMTQAKHVDVEVVSQEEARSRRIIELLGGDDSTPRDGFTQPRPLNVPSAAAAAAAAAPRRLFRLSDASGRLELSLVREGGQISAADLDGNDVFLLDDAGRGLWVWEGRGASRAEKARWLGAARAYVQRRQADCAEALAMPVAKVVEGFVTAHFSSHLTCFALETVMDGTIPVSIDSHACLSRPASYLRRAAIAASYPLRGIWYCARDRDFWPLFAGRLLPLSIISLVVYLVLFTFAFLPQYAFIAIIHGWGAWLNAVVLTLGEGLVITQALFEGFFVDECRVDVFDAVLIKRGLADLVAPNRLLHDDAPSAVKMLGKPTSPAAYQPWSVIQIIELIVFLPLNLVPVVGTPAFIIITGTRLGKLSQYRWFQLRGLSRRERKREIRTLTWDYMWFGTVAMVLELVPLLSFFFLLTTSAGSAAWAAAMEHHRRRAARAVVESRAAARGDEPLYPIASPVSLPQSSSSRSIGSAMWPVARRAFLTVMLRSPDGGSGAEIYGEPSRDAQGEGPSTTLESLPDSPKCTAQADTTTVFVTVYPTSPASADDSLSAAGAPDETARHTARVHSGGHSSLHSVSIWTTVTWDLSGISAGVSGGSGSPLSGLGATASSLVNGASPTTQGSPDGDYGDATGSAAPVGWPRPTVTSDAISPGESGSSGGDAESPFGTGLTAASDGFPSAYGSANEAQATPSDHGSSLGAGGSPTWQTVVTDTEVHWITGSSGPTPVTVLSEHTIFGVGPAQASAAGEAVTCLTTTGPDGRPTVFQWPGGSPQANGSPVVSTAGASDDNGDAGVQAFSTLNAPASAGAASTTCTKYTVLGTDGVPTVVHSSWLVPEVAPVTAAPGSLPSGVSGPVSAQNAPNGAGVTTCTSYTILGPDGRLTVVESTVILPGTAGVQGGDVPGGFPAQVTSLTGGPGSVQPGDHQLPGGGHVTCTTFTVLGADGRPTVVDTSFVAPGPAATPVTTVTAGGVFTGVPSQITNSAVLPQPAGGAGTQGVTTCIIFTTLGPDGKPTAVESTVVVPATIVPEGAFTGAPAQITGSAVLPQPAGGARGVGAQGVTTCITFTTLGPDGAFTGAPAQITGSAVLPQPAGGARGVGAQGVTTCITFTTLGPDGAFTGAPAQITGSAVLPQPAAGGAGSQVVTTCITFTTLGPDGKPTAVESTVVVPATLVPGGAFTGSPAQITESAVLPQPAAGGAGAQGVTTCITFTTLGPDGKPTAVESTMVVPASNALPPVTVLGLPSFASAQPSNLPQGAPVFTSLGSPITTCLTFDVLGPNGVATPVVRTVVLTPAAAPSVTTLGYPSITAQQQATDLPQGVPPYASSNGAITTFVTMYSVGPNGVATPVVQTVVLTPSAAALGLPTAPQTPNAAGLTLQPPGPVVTAGSPPTLAPGAPNLNAYGPDASDVQTAVPPPGVVSGLNVGTLTGPLTTVLTLVAGQPGASGAAGLPFPYGDGSDGTGVSAAGVGAQPGDANNNGYGWSPTANAGPYGPMSSPVVPQPLLTVTTLQTVTWTNFIPEPTTTYTMNFPLTTLETVTISAPLGKRLLRRQQSSLLLDPSWSNATAIVPPVAPVPTPVPDVPVSAVSLVPTVPSSAPVCAFGGKIGNTTVNFDDIKPGPLFNPSGDVWFSEGFLVAPPAAQVAQSFVPSSGGQLVEFVPPSLASLPIGHLGSGDRAEVGVGPNAPKPCFRFDFFSAELGCAATAAEGWCEFEVAAYRYDPAVTFEQSIAWSETKRVPACPSFPSGSCALTPVDFEGYTNISSVLIYVRVGLEMRAWWGDDFKFGWTDNSCEAASCRSLAAPQHVKRETVELALRRGIWHWTPAGLQRLDDDYILESAY